jgi:two-component system NtrC family sensor kinase
VKTIRAKVAVFFALCLMIIIAVTAVYYKNIFSLRQKLIEIENLDDFLNDVLELRRYEKNFIYYRDLESLKESEFYLLKIETASEKLVSHITAEASESDYRNFKQNLASYKTILDENRTLIDTGITDAQLTKIREKGKALLYFSQKLIEAKRERVRAALNRTLSIIPLAFLGILVVFIVVMVHLLTKGIFEPLSLIEKATDEVAKETFTPIAYQTERRDEITHLIQAFNNMARELDVRQQQLLHSRKLASIGTFTSGIAHELSNPLNNISLTAETLQLGWKTMSGNEMKDLIDDILTQAERAGQVVKNLLDFSRSKRRAVERLQIRDVIEETLKLVKNQLTLADLQLKLDISNDLPPIDGSSEDLQHVFLNMFLNAIDATAPKGIISIKARRAPGRYIRIDLTDTGTGIKPDDMEHLFDPFFTTKEVGNGTGLGLSLAYGIIRSHGGHIEVKSELEKGTTFSIFLRAAKQDKAGVYEDKNSRHRR